jgi:hypothetical protein
MNSQKDQLIALRQRLITLNSQFREADNDLTAANTQTEIWNVLAAIAHLEAEVGQGHGENDPKN